MAKNDNENDRVNDRVNDREDNNGCTGQLLEERGKGPEDWSPLWANIADRDKATRVKEVKLNPQNLILRFH